YLLSLLLLARLPEEAWADPAAVEQWIEQHHPYWHQPSQSPGSAPQSSQHQGPQHPPPSTQHTGLATFLLGFAYPLRLVQAVKDADGKWLVRLSLVGRWLLGAGPRPTLPTEFRPTLL